MKPRTSTSHPLLIDTVSVPSGGQIGMTLCPGRRDNESAGGPWNRDLGADLDVIGAWTPDLILTLMESSEFARFGVPQFAEVCGGRFPMWRHLPIVDADVPDQACEHAWKTVGPESSCAKGIADVADCIVFRVRVRASAPHLHRVIGAGCVTLWTIPRSRRSLG
jgi:hypothetical protein